MNRIAALLVGALLALPAHAIALRFPLAINYDNSFDTEFKAGNKLPTVTCPNWNCIQTGTASGDINEAAPTTLDFGANGPDDYTNYGLAYKAFPNTDVQTCATVPDQSAWTGTIADFAGFGVKVQEGTTTPGYFCHVWLVGVNDIPRFKCGTGAAFSSTSGDIATVAPETLCVTVNRSLGEWKGWQSNDGVTFNQIGTTVTHAPSGGLNAGAFGSSFDALQTVFAELTNVTATNTITIGGAPPAAGGCIAGARTAGTTFGSGFDLTYNADCGAVDDIVNGWDFSLPFSTEVAPRSGVFITPVQNYFKGNHLYTCQLEWKDIEPSDDAWNNSTIDACFGSHPGYDGTMVNVRGTQATVRNCANNADTKTSEWHAPTWAKNIAGLVTQSCHNNVTPDFQIRSIDLDNDTTTGGGGTGTPHDEFIEYITHVANYIVSQGYVNQNFWQIMHVASSSLGEECCGGFDGDPDGAGPRIAPTLEIIDIWSAAYGSNAWKLGWIKEDSPEYERAVDTDGMGVRGGIIENWLRTVYTPGDKNKTGQQLDGSGYLTINPSFKPISELRHFMDEMEEFGATAKFPANHARNYIAAGLRSMQMRRNLMWLDSQGAENPRLDDWMSLEMGKTAATTSDAWAWLMQTSTYSGGIKAINNFERHLMQREALGATTATNNLAHGYNASANSSLSDQNEWDARWSRRGAHIGFALEDAFWPIGLTNNVVIKITYVDTGNDITINYNGGATKVIDVQASGLLKTSTTFINNFTAPAVGTAEDFYLTVPTGNTDIVFVRVIKTGGGFPLWTP